ncbi:hypothetical protein NHH03_26095 [Stieleria sp. TO1_6]|uniref:hypothetical protein n=1 Tax=Stieleria tagensis TaxID=2956795 RepID=UPI00209B8EA0|nr:hypothetical protein [Stieleria tagensis]MCO8125236.1 hypothetical protein [Stieleria tagensis]
MIYKLFKIMEITEYEGFVFRDKEIQDRFAPQEVPRLKRDWIVPKLGDTWDCPEVIGSVSSLNDFPCVACMVPAFSSRATDVLHGMLQASGEILPLSGDGKGFFAFNVLTKADVLNRGRSVLQWLGKSEQPMDCGIPATIEKYEFNDIDYSGYSFFRIPDDLSSIYVTQQVFETISNNNLKGFHCVKVWPNNDGKSWRERDFELDRAEKKTRSI